MIQAQRVGDKVLFTPDEFLAGRAQQWTRASKISEMNSILRRMAMKEAEERAPIEPEEVMRACKPLALAS